MTRKGNNLQRGQGLVEYALLLTLVSVTAIVGLEIFGDALATEYCQVLNALGTTETFCPASEGGAGAPSDEGGPADPGEPGTPGNPGSPGDGGDDEGTGGNEGTPGDNGNGGDEPGPGGDDGSGDNGDGDENNGDDGAGGDGQGDGQDDDGNNPPPQDDPQPGTLAITKINTNKPHTQIKFDVQYNGGYEKNVMVNAYFDGTSLYVPKHNSGKYYSIKKYVDVSRFPLAITIKAIDSKGIVLATLDCVIQGSENGNGAYCGS